MLRSKDLARQDMGTFYLIGAGRRAHKVFKVGYNEIKVNVLGKSTILEIIVNSPIDASVALIYTFPQEKLKKDSFLRALLFGRETTNFQFTATNAIIGILFNDYAGYVSDIKDIYSFDFSANCGIQGEQIRCNNDGAKSISVKMDKQFKVDYSYNHHFTQCKVSLRHYGTNENDSKSYSFSKTNKSAK